MDFESFRSKATDMEGLRAYIKTLPEEAREAAEEMIVNLEPRVILSKTLIKVLEHVVKDFPSMKTDGMTTLVTLACMSSMTNIDSIILRVLQQEGVLDVIERIVKEKNRMQQESEGTPISEVLKDFKFSNN